MLWEKGSTLSFYKHLLHEVAQEMSTPPDCFWSRPIFVVMVMQTVSSKFLKNRALSTNNYDQV